MDWQGFLKDMNRDLGQLRPQIPDTAHGFSQMAKAATAPGALDTRTKELIALAIGVAGHCEPCIGFHAKALRQLGVTRQELAEVLGVCVYMGGGPALMYAAKAMAAFDQLESDQP